MTVQWSPAWPVYVEHSFVRWKAPLRVDDGDNDGASACWAVAVLPDAVALGAAGAPGPSAHATAVSAMAQRDPTTTRWIGRQIVNFIIHTPTVAAHRGSAGSNLDLHEFTPGWHTSAESATTTGKALMRAVAQSREGFPGGVPQAQESDACEAYVLSKARAREERLSVMM
jgi:hypothetical protein